FGARFRRPRLVLGLGRTAQSRSLLPGQTDALLERTASQGLFLGGTSLPRYTEVPWNWRKSCGAAGRSGCGPGVARPRQRRGHVCALDRLVGTQYDQALTCGSATRADAAGEGPG